MKPNASCRHGLLRAALITGCLIAELPAIQVAGSLLVDLEANDFDTVNGIWPQNSLTGIQGSFGKQANGTPKLETIAGTTALVFDGDGDYLTGPNTTAALHGLNASHSVEYWAFQGQIRPEEAVLSWSRRDGPDGTFAGFRYASNGSWGCAARWGQPDMGFAGTHLGGPAAGAWHHIVVTYDGGTKTQKIFVDGALNATEVSTPNLDAKDNFPIIIGGERNNAGDDAGRFFQFSGAISKIRIHSGVLSDTAVTANYNEELGAHPGITPAQLPKPPIHRFSFSNAAGVATDGSLVTDSLGGLTGTIRGTGANFTGTAVELPGGASSASGAYIDLPNGILSSKSRVSLEIWSTQTTDQSWGRLMSFNISTAGEVTATGNPPAFDGAEGLALMANMGTDKNYRLERLGGAPTNGANQRTSEGATVLGAQLHHVITYDPAVAEWRIYRNGFLMEVLPETLGPTSIEDVNNWIGRSEFNSDNRFNGSINEFRVYNYALNESQIRGNFNQGPDVVNLAGASNSLTWTPAAGGTFNFDNSGGQNNWATGAGGTFPDSAGATGTLLTNLTGDETVALNTTATVGTLIFGDTDGSNRFNFTAGTGGSFELNAGGGFVPSITQLPSSAGDTISAPIALTTDSEFTNLGTQPLVISGTLSGAGRLMKGGFGLITLAADSPGYTANVLVNTGRLRIGNGGTTGSLGTTSFSGTDEGSLSFNRSNTYTFTGTISGPIAVFQDGPGTFVNNGTINSTGRLTVSNNASFTNQATVNGTNSLFSDGAVLLKNGSTTNPNGFVSIGTADGGTLTFESGASMMVNGGGDFNIADFGTGTSVLVLPSGSSLNVGTVWAGRNDSTAGVILQSGGSFFERAGGADNRLGGNNVAAAGAFGAWIITGGTLNSNHNFQIGAFGTGIMTVDGGAVIFNGGFPVVGRFQEGAVEGYGLLDVRAGSVSQTVAGNRLIIGEEAFGTLNVSGTGVVNLTGGLLIGSTDGSDSGDGTVNLLPGGTLETQLIGQGGGGAAQGSLNFHGGTLRAKGNAANFMGGFDHAYLYPGGALIEVPTGVSVTASQLLEAPTGNGVTSIPVTNGGSGYLAAPFIEITGGGGSGATAVANLSSGAVSSITVTNPGVGYTSAPSINLRGGAGGTGFTAGTPALAANSGGGLTTTGGGTQTAAGTTTVAAGATLAGDGTLGGNLIANGKVSPGPGIGIITVNGNVDFNAGSKLLIEIDDSGFPTNDLLEVNGNVDFAGCKLEVGRIGTPTNYPFVIATWTGSRGGTTFTVPSNITVTYNANSVQIDSITPTAFDNWIAPFFPNESNPDIIGNEADPDGDGQLNFTEFALGGNPSSGADNPKIYAITADGSVDGDSLKELLMTIAVRAGNDGNGGVPTFTGSPPTAIQDGVRYRVQGSTTLSSFPAAVTPVNVVLPAGVGAAPAGYEYRTFSLNDSNGIPNRGFLRVEVTEAP